MELRDNVLKTLPASMSSLTKLRVLDLGSNLLEDLVSSPMLTLMTDVFDVGHFCWLQTNSCFVYFMLHCVTFLALAVITFHIISSGFAMAPPPRPSFQSEYTFRRQLKTWLFNKSFPDIIISDIDCISTFSLGLSVPTVRRFCCLKSKI